MMRINKHLYKNSFLLSLPGMFSIFLSLLSIPFHIKIAGFEDYGNYLFFHFLLSISFLLNMGLAKTLVIGINKNPNYKSQIIYEGFKYCFFICLTLILIFTLINQLSFFENIIPFSKKYFFIGLILSVIYLVLEAIYQANKFFLNLAISNFIFYSLSLSLPSLLMIYYGFIELDKLILISILIKFLILIIIFIIIINKKLVKKSKKNRLSKYIKINSLWITLFNLLVQFYEMFDKYVVSIFLGPISLSVYSIPQQITGKLTIITRAFSSYLLPYLSSGKKNLDFNQSINIFLSYVPLVIFSLFPLYDKFLHLWLGSDYNPYILILTKIFSLVAIFSGNSHILITRFEADQTSKKNFYYELCILPFFLFFLFFIVTSYKSLLYISYLILVKETILLLIRLFNLKHKVSFLGKYSLNILSFAILLILSNLNFLYFYILIIMTLFMNLYNDRKHI